MKKLLMSLAAASSALAMAPAANAAVYNIVINTPTQTFDNEPGAVCAPTSPCGFNDTFNITISAALLALGYNQIGGTITTGPSTDGAAGDVDFGVVTLNGGAFTMNVFNDGSSQTEQGFTGYSNILAANTLSVNGTAYSAAGTPAKYSGTLQLRINSAVPEPATWALMILGFGAVGYSMRRRPTARFAQAV
jgi:hypothetical protein